MSGYKYYTVLTDIGKQKLINAISSETPLDFTEIAVGDSNGVSYDPSGEETALKHEVFRKTIDSCKVDDIDSNVMIFEMVVPSSSGGYYIREAGLFDGDGDLIAIARLAEQYKPQLSEGAGASIDINMRIAISSEAQIYINVPESDSYATHKYVAEEFKKHTQEENPHQQYMFKTYANEKFATKAEKTHNHDSVYVKKADTVNLPVGFIYIQLRGQSTPDVLFNTTGKWQDISSTYAGEFFRAVGGNSASFGSKQNEGLPNITGISGGVDSSGVGESSGCFGAQYVKAAVLSGGGGTNYKITFSAKKSNPIYGASTHVTPYNSAVRIWKKIS